MTTHKQFHNCSYKVVLHHQHASPKEFHPSVIQTETGVLSGSYLDAYGKIGGSRTCTEAKRKFVSIVGYKFTLALTDEGELYSAGNNSYGELGQGHMNSTSQFERVHGLDGKRVVSVAAGHYHSLCETDDGEVYMWGYSAFTQCANAIDQKIPTLVPEVGRIQGKIKSLGGWHSLLLTRQGVYGWGHNDDGRCGVPTLPYQKHLTSPTLVQFPELFIDVVGAAYHTLALTVSGKVVAWGTDYYLTIGNSKTRQDVFSPVYVEFFKSMIVERIFSSSDAQANMVISNGSVFAWGSNRGSVFALGDGNILPRKIEGLNGFEIGNINLAELNYLFTQD